MPDTDWITETPIPDLSIFRRVTLLGGPDKTARCNWAGAALRTGRSHSPYNDNTDVYSFLRRDRLLYHRACRACPVIAPPRAHPFFRVGAPHRYDNHTSMIIFINPSFLLAYIAYLSKFIKPCNNIISLFNGCTFNWHHRSTHSCLCC